MKDEILKMLLEIKPDANFMESSDFTEDELLDSFDIISLISMLEERYNVVIAGVDIVPENFGQLDSIMELVKRSEVRK